MTFLLGQIFLSLLVAAIIGALGAWFFCSAMARNRESALQHEWRAKLRQIESDRDQSFVRLRSESAQLTQKLEQQRKLHSDKEAQLNQYEQGLNNVETELRLQQSAAEEFASSHQQQSTQQTRLLEQTALQLKSAQDELDARHARVGALEKHLAQRDSQISTLQDALKNRSDAEAALQGLEQQLSERKTQLETSQRQLDSATAQVRQLKPMQAELADMKNTLAAAHDEVGNARETEQTVRRLRRDLAERATELDALQTNETAQQAELARLRAQHAEQSVPGPERFELASEPLPAQQSSQKKMTAPIVSVGGDAAAGKDDLKRIRGIGPVLERTLNGLGICSFQQIAALGADDVTRVAESLGTFPDRILRDDWVGQAKRILEES